MSRERISQASLNRQRISRQKQEAQELKAKGWVTTGDFPYIIERESGYKVRAGAVGSLGMRKLLEEVIQRVRDDPEYRENNVRIIARTTFISSDLFAKMKALTMERVPRSHLR